MRLVGKQSSDLGAEWEDLLRDSGSTVL
jgi:hypothetical protein